MTEDQILSVAREAGWNIEHEQTNKMLIQLVNQAIKSEREAESWVLSERESLDVAAMGEAQVVLQVIKDTDPGVYDEMIDNALRLIAKALDFKAEEE